MNLIPFSELPAPEVEPFCDWALLADNSAQKLLLAYACHRDFLSAPRHYALLEICGSGQDSLEYHCLEAEYFWQEEGAQAPAKPGWYSVQGMDDLAGGQDIADLDAPEILLLISSAQVLEVGFSAYRLLQTGCHQPSAQAVIASHLAE